MSRVDDLQDRAQPLLDDLEELVREVPSKGDKSEDCQRLTILQAISEVYYALNGLKEEDFDEDEDQCNLFEHCPFNIVEQNKIIMNFEDITLRQEISSRGGGVEIDLSTLGFEGEKMSAYQNYLGGGMLGRVCANDTIRANNSIVEESICKELDKIAEELKKYYFELTNPDTEWESQTFEQNQKMPVSGY